MQWEATSDNSNFGAKVSNYENEMEENPFHDLEKVSGSVLTISYSKTEVERAFFENEFDQGQVA